MSIRIQSYTQLDDTVLEVLAALESAIFEQPMSRAELDRALRRRHNLSVLVALRDESGAASVPCGFKVGYELSPDVFYSFIGGVTPECRHRGIARALMAEQHRIATDLGYGAVRTHTKNKYRDMLVLNIRSGFDVIGVHHRARERFATIVLEKQLNSV